VGILVSLSEDDLFWSLDSLLLLGHFIVGSFILKDGSDLSGLCLLAEQLADRDGILLRGREFLMLLAKDSMLYRDSWSAEKLELENDCRS